MSKTLDTARSMNGKSFSELRTFLYNTKNTETIIVLPKDSSDMTLAMYNSVSDFPTQNIVHLYLNSQKTIECMSHTQLNTLLEFNHKHNIPNSLKTISLNIVYDTSKLGGLLSVKMIMPNVEIYKPEECCHFTFKISGFLCEGLCIDTSFITRVLIDA